ncbi:hypothetical protein SAMN05421858_0923 [Haladaptatus litoreus]|uniref:Uncharacterized protein n=1 Tax=Haladaptatus litoreus TaxID=553468 RepID=A0A1N6WZ53_9EURY|nr:hypothetical protein SAMN05421858_0923 [Haladaptatus litoreus]
MEDEGIADERSEFVVPSVGFRSFQSLKPLSPSIYQNSP